MFQLMISQPGSSETFETKDALISQLEKENVRCIEEQLSITCRILHMDTEGEVLESTEVILPIFEGQLMDELLMSFGNQKVKKSASNHKKKHTPPHSSSKQKPVKTRQTSLFLVLVSLISFILALAGLGLSGMVYSKLQAQDKAITQLERRLEDEQEETAVTRKLDVFCRYFIPNYFSGNTSALESFRGAKEKWGAQTGTVQSVILLSSKQTKKGYLVEYVIAVQRNGETNREYLEMEIGEDEKGMFGFSILSEPKLSDESNTD